MFTTFDPMRPLPPMTTIFILFFVSDASSFIMTAASSHYGCLAKRFSVAHEKLKFALGLIQFILGGSPFSVRFEGQESTRGAQRTRTVQRRSMTCQKPVEWRRNKAQRRVFP